MSEFARRRYYKRKSVIMKMERKVLNAKRNIRRFRVLLRASLIFLLVYFSCKVLSLDLWYLNPDYILELNPSIVQIQGNIITPEYRITDIIRAAEIPDVPIFKYSTKSLEESIEELQPVKKVYIRRFWLPARIIVFIEEREPVFLIAPNDETPPISAVTRDGHYIDREYMPISSKFKTTKILSYGPESDNYENWDKKRVDELLKVVNKIEAYSKEKVLYFDLRNPNDIYVKLEEVLIRLGKFDSAIDDRIKWIPTILPKVKEEILKGEEINYIDLRWNDAQYIKYMNKKAPAQTLNKTEKELVKNENNTENETDDTQSSE